MRRQRNSAMDERDEDDDSGRRRPASKKSGSWRFWLGSRLLVVVVLFGVLAYIAPVAIGSGGLWKTVLSYAAPEVAKQISAQSMQLGWFSPVEIRGLAVRDIGGQPLAAVDSIRSRKTLLQLALNYGDVGTFEVDSPKARIVLRADGSNVEDLLAKLPKSEGKSESVGFGLVLTKGLVEFDDQVAGRQWVVNNIGVEVNSPLAADQAKSGKLTAAISPAGGNAPASQLAADFSWQPGRDEKSPLGSGQAKVAIQGFPTEIVEGAARRFAVDVRPRGPLTVQAGGAWKEGGAIQLAVDQLATPGISVAAPKLLGSDRPTLVISSGKANVQLANNLATVNDLQLVTNLVSVGGKGSATIGGGQPNANDLELSGQINLAELARQLPGTLRLRPDTQVQSGVAEIVLASQSTADGRRWTGSLKTRDLGGIAAGRPLRLEQPLSVSFGVRQTASGPVIDQLLGQASFLRLEGRGRMEDGKITAEADLDKLVEELERLVDLRDLRLSGRLASELWWKQDAQRGWTANADTIVQNFSAVAPGIMPWKEPKLHLAVNVQGALAGSSLAQVDGAKLLLEAGSDRLDVDLTQPVKAPSASSAWPIKFGLKGDLASWTPRLQAMGPLKGWRMVGLIDASGTGRVSPQESEFAQSKVEINQLEVVGEQAADGSRVEIRESVVKLETAGTWSQAKSTLTLGSTTFASSALAFRADGVRVVLGSEPSIVGLIDFRGDLARFASWLPKSSAPTTQVAGSLEGKVEIGYRGQALAADWNAKVDNLALLTMPTPAQQAARPALASRSESGGWQPVWQEPRVTFSGQGTFDPAAGTLKVERTALAASCLSLGAGGTVSKITSSPEIDLSGEIAYDLGQVTQQIQARMQQPGQSGAAPLPYGLDTLQLAGKERRQFVLKGPLFAATGNLTPVGSAARSRSGESLQTATNGRGFGLSEALVGEASLGWEGAQYVGLVAGPADFRAKLTGGVLNIGPLDIPLSEGRLTTAPRIMLANRERAAVVERGPVLTNVRISPEMCTLWLKYVAPMVADATRAEGKFSLSLNDAANVPLSAPLASSINGTLAIQSAQIGPGPLPQQFLGIVKQVRSFFDAAGGAAGNDANRGWLVLPQQEVQFEVREGVVYNRGLKMSLGDVVITTEGSVAIESQQINLMTSIPIQESWIKKQEGLLGSLKGQVIQIPVTGTLKQPRLDTRVLETLGKQIAGSALQGAAGKLLERGLQGIGTPGGTPPGNTQPGAAQPGGMPRGVEGLLPGGLGQGLNRLFGPQPGQPQPNQPQPRPAPR